jgi:hypothetical protein
MRSIRRSRRRLTVLLLVGVASAGCREPGGDRAAGDAAPPAASAAADAGMREALSLALQAQGTRALERLRSLDSAELSPRYRPTHACMLGRLSGEDSVPMAVADPFIAGVLADYREYWLRALMNESPTRANETRLLAALNARVESVGGQVAPDLDALEPTLEALIRGRGHHALLGVTSPLRELMLWKTEAERRYDVGLPEGNQPVQVVFMDDFTSLGWAGFATCDRQHTGGWTRPDRLYAVGSAYDTTSENFRVSYLAHEAQHFADNRRFPRIARQEELEYRAKLVELAVGRESVYELLDAFAANVSADTNVPHSYANGRVVRDMASRIGLADAEPRWRDVEPSRINSAATELLLADSDRLKRP